MDGRELLELLLKVESIPVKVYGQDGETIYMPHYCLPYLKPDMDLFG